MHVCVYFYIHNNYTRYTHIYFFKQMFLFWMRFNNLKALVLINNKSDFIYIIVFIKVLNHVVFIKS